MTNETSNETDSDEGDGSAINEHPFQLDEKRVSRGPGRGGCINGLR